MTWAKVFVLDRIADWGLNLAISDLDVVWFRDPSPLLDRYPAAGGGPAACCCLPCWKICPELGARVLRQQARLKLGLRTCCGEALATWLWHRGQRAQLLGCGSAAPTNRMHAGICDAVPAAPLLPVTARPDLQHRRHQRSQRAWR